MNIQTISEFELLDIELLATVEGGWLLMVYVLIGFLTVLGVRFFITLRKKK